MVEIIPAILTNDIREIEEKLSRAEGIVKRIQIDIIDGVFAANRTIDPSFLENIETDLDLDFHLMTKDPTSWVERAVRGGAERIIGQIEEMADQVEFVGKVAEVGLSVGLAIDLETPVSALDPTIITNLDVVLVMAVKAGFGGQKFDERALNKIKQLDELRVRDDTPFRICVDGGITEENIKKVVKTGADEVAIGSRIFDGDLAENIRRFEEAAHG
ncbi:MAG: Ribulose-phosphate 3-epimerase [Candidatus Woesebacteria bacterium GW2011_GWF2_46_8]|uniref:Ribulose-phosphate 3-epimerase n=1 Tax=Candidatus Woesebacteria bacterium GW2011_GWF2_46_8 TaxID=1618604 RepID=A0A0G1T0D9_9BACT|nr:MAG: Ribulose-phosphate 3-epimerase [Candidatus Woesebacteria bacterium GW2011_GWF2_46_8]